MDPSQECLLSDESASYLPSRLSVNNTRWRKNLLFLFLALSIASCLTIYIYLNMEAIDENQSDLNRYKPLSRRKPMLDHESIFSDSGPSMIKVSDLLAHCLVALQIAGREVVKLSLAQQSKLDNVASKGKTLEGVDDVVTGADLKSHQMILDTIKDSYRRLQVVSEEDDTKKFEYMSVENDILPIERIEFAKLLRASLHEIEGNNLANKASLVAQHETLIWIDPLDATKEYSENLTSYVTLMACIVHKSVPIAGVIHKPFINRTYWSMQDVSSGIFHHSPNLEGALVESKNQYQNRDSVRLIVSRSHAGNVKKVLEKAYGQRAQIISAGGSGYKTIELLHGKVDAYMHLTHIKKWDICGPNAILNSIPGAKFTDLNGNLIKYGDAKDKVIETGLVASLDSKVSDELIDLIRNSGN